MEESNSISDGLSDSKIQLNRKFNTIISVVLYSEHSHSQQYMCPNQSSNQSAYSNYELRIKFMTSRLPPGFAILEHK